MNTRKKLIVLTASACAVISAGLGVSTVAWFTANREVTFSYQNIRAHGTVGDLKIAYTPVKNAAAANDATTDYDVEVGVVDTLVSDISGSSKDNLLKPTWEGNKATFGSPEDTDYVQFTLAITNEGEDTVGLYFNGASDTIAAPSTGNDGSSQVRMHVTNGTWNKLFSENTEDPQNYISSDVDYARYTASKGVAYYDDSASTSVTNEAVGTGDGDKKSFALKHKVKSGTTPTFTVGGTAATGTVTTNRRDESVVTFDTAPAADAQIVAAYTTTEIDLPTTSVIDPSTYSYESTDTSASANYIANLAKNASTTLTVTIWFEGTYTTDADDKNDIQNNYNDYGWSIFLDFVAGAAAA